MSSSVLSSGIGASGGSDGKAALEAIAAGSSPALMDQQTAQLRFDTENGNIQLRLGEKVASGTFYLWHPADEGGEGGLADTPAFLDLVLTRGGLRGTLKGRVFSNAGGKAVLILSSAGGERPPPSFGGFPEAGPGSEIASSGSTLLVLARPGAQAAANWPWPPSIAQPSSSIASPPLPVSPSSPSSSLVPPPPPLQESSEQLPEYHDLPHDPDHAPSSLHEHGDGEVNSAGQTWSGDRSAIDSSDVEGGGGVGHIQTSHRDVNYATDKSIDLAASTGKGSGLADGNEESDSMAQVVETCTCCVGGDEGAGVCCKRLDDDVSAAVTLCRSALQDYLKEKDSLHPGSGLAGELAGSTFAARVDDDDADTPQISVARYTVLPWPPSAAVSNHVPRGVGMTGLDQNLSDISLILHCEKGFVLTSGLSANRRSRVQVSFSWE